MTTTHNPEAKAIIDTIRIYPQALGHRAAYFYTTIAGRPAYVVVEEDRPQGRVWTTLVVEGRHVELRSWVADQMAAAKRAREEAGPGAPVGEVRRIYQRLVTTASSENFVEQCRQCSNLPLVGTAADGTYVDLTSLGRQLLGVEE